ncbi:MAG: hypothetical protein J6X49_04260 [Victivallales bacterium]|nr:hypothetical protein [Victivallales bacterium]
MKARLFILVCLLLALHSSLKAGEDAMRADDATLSRSSEKFAYDILNVTESDNFESECKDNDEDKPFGLSDECLRKVGQPTPGIMLTLLMAGGLVRLMLRLRRRITKRLEWLFANALSFMFANENNYALSLYNLFIEICWLKWQRVELRL